MTRTEALVLLKHTADAVVDTVREAPQGAPAGPMYAAFVAHGMSLEMFDAITGALVEAGKIRRQGDLFFPV